MSIDVVLPIEIRGVKFHPYEAMHPAEPHMWLVMPCGFCPTIS